MRKKHIFALGVGILVSFIVIILTRNIPSREIVVPNIVNLSTGDVLRYHHTYICSGKEVIKSIINDTMPNTEVKLQFASSEHAIICYENGVYYLAIVAKKGGLYGRRLKHLYMDGNSSGDSTIHANDERFIISEDEDFVYYYCIAECTEETFKNPGEVITFKNCEGDFEFLKELEIMINNINRGE